MLNTSVLFGFVEVGDYFWMDGKLFVKVDEYTAAPNDSLIHPSSYDRVEKDGE